MPADSRDMVLVPLVPTEAMMRAWNEAVPDAVEPPHADGWTPPADTTFRARWQAALSASPAREGDLGSSASPIPTVQAGRPVHVFIGRGTFERQRQQARASETYQRGDMVMAWVNEGDIYANPSVVLEAAPSTTSTAEQVGQVRDDIRRWMTDQREWFHANIVEIVTEYAEWRDRQEIAPSPGEGDAPVASGEDPHEMFEAFVAEAIAKSPEPLQELGRFLADRLDEDDWKTADRLLLQIATRPTPATPEGLREKVVAPDTVEKLFWDWWHNKRRQGEAEAAAFHAGYLSALQPQAQPAPLSPETDL